MFPTECQCNCEYSPTIQFSQQQVRVRVEVRGGLLVVMDESCQMIETNMVRKDIGTTRAYSRAFTKRFK